MEREAYSVNGVSRAFTELDTTNKAIINRFSYGKDWNQLASKVTSMLTEMHVSFSHEQIENGSVIQITEDA